MLDAGTARLIANPESRQLLIELMYEVIEGARSCGYDLAHDYPDKLIAMTAALPDYQPSIYLDHTVRFHVSSILAKLGAATRTEAVSIGMRRGLVAIQ